jgi:hypothetical protein
MGFSNSASKVKDFAKYAARNISIPVCALLLISSSAYSETVCKEFTINKGRMAGSYRFQNTSQNLDRNGSPQASGGNMLIDPSTAIPISQSAVFSVADYKGLIRKDFFGSPTEIAYVIRSAAFPNKNLVEDFYISTGAVEASGAKINVYSTKIAKRTPASKQVRLKNARYIAELGRAKFFIDDKGQVFEIQSSLVTKAPPNLSQIRVKITAVGAVSNDNCQS